MSPLAVYGLQNNQLTLTTAEGQNKAVTFPCRLPAIAQPADTGYFFLHFGGFATHATKGYVPVLVVNTGHFRDALFYVDYNLNFDFTDDGAPIVFKRKATEVSIYLKQPADTLAFIHYRISRFNHVGKESYLAMLDEFYKMQEKHRVFKGAYAMYREQRYNCQGAMYVSASDSFRIGLLDVNCNGLYNEPGIDKLLIGEYTSTKGLPVEVGFGATILPNNKQELLVEHGWSRYRITNLNPHGESLSIEKLQEEEINSSLLPGKKAPKVIFMQANGKPLKLKRLRRHPVFMFFLKFPYDDFARDTATLSALQHQYPNLRIIWIHYGGNPKTLPLIASQPNITWYTAYTNRQLNKQLGISGFPYGILLGKKRVVVQTGIQPGQVDSFMPKNK